MGGFSSSLAPEPLEGNSLTRSIRGMVNAQSGAGTSFIDQAKSLMGPAASYWLNLLSGNQAQTAAAVAPETARARQGVQTAMSSASALAPRGGGRGEALFAAPMQGASIIQGQQNSLRPQAAQQAGGFGTQLGGLGAGLLGNAAQAQLGVRGQDVQADINGPKGTFLRGLAAVSGNAANARLAG